MLRTINEIADHSLRCASIAAGAVAACLGMLAVTPAIAQVDTEQIDVEIVRADPIHVPERCHPVKGRRAIPVAGTHINRRVIQTGIRGEVVKNFFKV